MCRDQEARAGLEQLQQKIKKQTNIRDRWATLNSVMGSYDGNNFRKFAQGLNLEIVLSYANSHLRELRPRYQLEGVPGRDLDIQVIDCDMAEERRSLASLSGGESFLVSLALALGLSDSSGQTRSIESLFIDEGFGTLDTETLDSALSVLETLEASGRQIGIISHVEGLADRTEARIEIKPSGFGHSQVTVRGAIEAR